MLVKVQVKILANVMILFLSWVHSGLAVKAEAVVSGEEQERENKIINT